MSHRFIRSLRKASNFLDWLERIKRFDYALVKENNLQTWTMVDYKNYWLSTGRTI